MTKYLVVIDSDGTISEKKITEHPTKEEIIHVLGEECEEVPYFFKYMNRNCSAFYNPDWVQKKGRDFSVNFVATRMWREQVPDVGYIHGPMVVVCGTTEWLEKFDV